MQKNIKVKREGPVVDGRSFFLMKKKYDRFLRLRLKEVIIKM